MEQTTDTDKYLNAFKAIVLNTHINNYAVERVAFGFEKPGDKAPIDLYLRHIFLGFDYEPQMRRNIPGVFIDEREHISAEYDYSEYVHDLFVHRMESIFFNAPKDIRLERDGEKIPLLPRFREYLFGLLPLFEEVLNTEVEYGVLDVIPTDITERASEYHKWVKFVTAILLKPLRSGSQINRYVKDVKNLPYYVRRLIEKKGNCFYLKPIDINGYEYAFALFSLMNFLNAENGKILELKMLEWERRHKLA